MGNYRITITPLEYYFFGGEKHDEELKINYFVESLDYPQQTTLLGMLRYLLLNENNLILGKSISDIEKAKVLIGEESFKYGKPQSFGVIKSLSPLYFSNGEDDFVFAPRDLPFSMDENFILHEGGKVYNAKDHYHKINTYLISQKSGKYILLSDIVKDVPQVGNQLPEKGGSKENAFYKQNLKRLEPGWSFVVDAEIDFKFDTQKEFKTPFGGEKKFCSVNVEKRDALVFNYPNSHKRTQKTIVCLSDCFIEKFKPTKLCIKIIKKLFRLSVCSETNKADFGVTDSVSFRNFRSNIHTKNHYALKKNGKIEESVVRSSRYQLLKRGSVFYFNNEKTRNKFANYIKNNYASTIGFNKIITN